MKSSSILLFRTLLFIHLQKYKTCNVRKATYRGQVAIKQMTGCFGTSKQVAGTRKQNDLRPSREKKTYCYE
ncbi:hypothetical protein Y032_0035g3147 [Ancylostoma ceylanicum]|uniref:Secreted protein n=1 Tax=Ancylostoma ceylanicum TaxID=53326 RepID=A0A016UMF6_9BILA|nr:hypothetical protein Y032_0035g3147 [Ancylostoma ceylanicum]